MIETRKPIQPSRITSRQLRRVMTASAGENQILMSPAAQQLLCHDAEPGCDTHTHKLLMDYH